MGSSGIQGAQACPQLSGSIVTSRGFSFASLSEKAESFFKKTEFLLMALGFFYLGIYSVEVLAEPPAETLAVLKLASTVIYVVFLLDLLARFVFQIP